MNERNDIKEGKGRGGPKTKKERKKPMKEAGKMQNKETCIHAEATKKSSFQKQWCIST